MTKLYKIKPQSKMKQNLEPIVKYRRIVCGGTLDCRMCKQDKPYTEFREFTDVKILKGGQKVIWHRRDTRCEECRKKQCREHYHKPHIKKKTQNMMDDPYSFVFSDKIEAWITTKDKLRWRQVWKDKQERKYLREGQFARI
jgi:hypothetical protein